MTVRPLLERSLSLPIGCDISVPDLIRVAAMAEDGGMDGVVSGELDSTELMSLLGAIAATTDRIRLETSVASVWSRSPALLAMAAVTIGALAPNRFALGLGVGSSVVAAYHGSAFGAPIHKVEAVVSDLRIAMDGGSLPGSGGFRLRGIRECSVPVRLGAMNDGMLRLAARISDGVILNFCSPAEVAAHAQMLRGIRREERGEDERPFEIHAGLWVAVGDDVELARRRLRMQVAPYVQVPAYGAALEALAGSDAVERTRAAWGEGGRGQAAAALPEEVVDALLVSGGHAQIARRLRQFSDAGCDGVRLTPLLDHRADASEVFDAVEALGEVLSEPQEIVQRRRDKESL